MVGNRCEWSDMRGWKSVCVVQYPWLEIGDKRGWKYVSVLVCAWLEIHEGD